MLDPLTKIVCDCFSNFKSMSVSGKYQRKRKQKVIEAVREALVLSRHVQPGVASDDVCQCNRYYITIG